MSIFKDVMNEHIEHKAKLEEAAREAQEKKISEDNSFLSSFKENTQQVAKPLFEEFVRDSISYGYFAKIEEGNDANNNPYYSLRFTPEIDKKLGISPESECLFSIKAILSDRQVEFAGLYDQRTAKKGLSKVTYGIQSIRHEVLDRELRKFFFSVLKSREQETHSI